MTADHLLDAIGNAKGVYVLDAQRLREGRLKVRRGMPRRLLLIAAIISLTLLLVGCAIVYALRLQDMKVGEELITQEEWHGPAGEYVPETQWVSSMFSLQGYNDSPAQLALRDWLAFQEQYDRDGSLLEANNFNESGVPDQYNLTYGCYTFEMVDALNAIAEKYGLKLLGPWMVLQRWESPIFYKALQIDSLCQSGVTVEDGSGYIYPEGSFHWEFHITLPGEETSRLVTMTYAQTEYFNPVPFAMGNVEDWQQWDYTTQDGTTVLLATHENALVIICNQGDGFLHVSTRIGDTLLLPNEHSETPMTRQEAEKIADAFNYSIHPQACNPGEVEAMRADYPEPKKAKDLYIGFMIDTSKDLWYPPKEIGDSYAHYIAYLLENDPRTQELEYCMMDVDQDGAEEVVIAHKDGSLREMLRIGDGIAGSSSPWQAQPGEQNVAIQFLTALCEGNIAERMTTDKYGGPTYYTYRHCFGDVVMELRHYEDAGVWKRNPHPGGHTEEPLPEISEAEAMEIIGSYKRIRLENPKPLTEFPMS